MTIPECTDCGAAFSERRAVLGYRLCLTCGEQAAREVRAGWCIAPVAHKQGSTLVTQREQLRGLNKVVPT
jgi:hypothetical protein